MMIGKHYEKTMMWGTTADGVGVRDERVPLKFVTHAMREERIRNKLVKIFKLLNFQTTARTMNGR